MLRQVHRWLSLIVLLGIITSAIPLTRPTTVAAAPSTVPVLTTDPPTIPRPSQAQSTGKPASYIDTLRQWYAQYHTLSATLNGTFNTPRRPAFIVPGPIAQPYQNASETIITLPAGVYESVESTVAIFGGTYGGTAAIQVRSQGMATWSESIPVFNHPGTNWNEDPRTVSGPGARITLGFAVLPNVPLDVKLMCLGGAGRAAQCTWSNLQFFTDAPDSGWRFMRPGSTTDQPMPTVNIQAAVYTTAVRGIAPQAEAFLGVETFWTGGGAGANQVTAYRSPLLDLPQTTEPITMSVQWARQPTASGIPDGADLVFVPLDGARETKLTLTAATAVVPWTRAESPPLPAGTRGYLQLRVVNGSVPRLLAFDSIAFYQGGKPIQVPADQTVGKCLCDVGGAIQVIFGDPVNTYSGAYYFQATDLALGSGGPSLTFGRTYVSMFTDPTYPTTTLGAGWRHTFADALTFEGTLGSGPATVIYEAATGNRLRFYANPDGQFDPAPGVRATLARMTDGSYTLTTRDGRIQRFDAQGRLIEQRDRQGRAQTLTYYDVPNTPQHRQLAQVTDSTTGRNLTLSYADYQGPRVVRVVDSANRAIQFGYTADGDLRTVTDVEGRTTTYGYDGTTHLLTTLDDPAGARQVTNTYRPDRRVGQQVEATGVTTTYAYQTATDGSQATTITRQTGTTTDVYVDHYRSDGSLEYQEHNGMLVSYMAYGTNFAPAVQVDGNGQRTRVRGDALGRPTVIEDAAQQRTMITYRGIPSTVTDATGQSVGTAYRADQHPVELISATGISTTLQYNAAGQVTRIDTTSADRSLVQSSTITYTTDQRVQEQRSPDGVVTRYEYDALGQVQRMTVGYGTPQAQVTTYGYDSVGRVTTVIEAADTPLARRTETIYNADGTVKKTIQNYKTGSFSAATPDQDVPTTYGYDRLGRQISVTDALGRTNVTHYSAAGQVDWTVQNMRPVVADSASLTGQIAFQPFVPAQPDRNVATLYQYDSLGRVELTTQTGIPSGTFDPATRTFSAATTRVTRMQYDDQNRLTITTYNYQPNVTTPQPDTNLQTITLYDGAGNITWTRDTLGRWTKTEYDALNRPVVVTQNYENGNPATIDGDNSPWATASDTDLQTKTTYRPSGQVERVISNHVTGQFDPATPTQDLTTVFQYDALERLRQTIASFDGPSATGVTTPLPSVNGTNRATQTVYNAQTGRVQGQRDALGHWTHLTYDALGRVVTTTQNCPTSPSLTDRQLCPAFDAAVPDRNVAQTQQYDALGRVVETQDATGQRTRTVYDGLGRVTTTIRNYDNGVVDPNVTDVDVTTRTVYDVLGRVVQQIDAAGQATSMAFDGLGQTTVITDSAGRMTRQGYDGTGTLRWTVRPGNRLTLYSVDGLGRTTATTENYGNGSVEAQEPTDQDLITRTEYDGAGRRVRSVDAAGRATIYRYDLLDRLTAVQENVVTSSCTTADCNVLTQYEYDRLGNRTAIVDARGKRRTFTFDAASQPRTAKDALGQQTAWTFDAGGRLLTQDAPGGTADDLQYTYDDLNRQTQVQAPNLPAPITTTYTARGQRHTLTDATGQSIFEYDALGRLTSVQAPNTGTVGYQYDARGLRTQLTYPNGPTVAYRYWPDGQLREVQQAGTVLAAYTYEATTGRLEQVEQANGAVTSYTFDDADRLTDVATSVHGALRSQFAYTVDRLGQRTVVTETMAQATSVPSVAFTSASSTTVAYNPYASVTADFNRDGHLDVATPNYGAARISVLLGQGNGTFNAATEYTVGSNPGDIAVGDLNQDGFADLVVANMGIPIVSVLLGQGDGTFATAVSVAVGSTTRAVALADLNQDGSLDLAVAHRSTPAVSLLLNQGNGAFGAATSLSFAAAPTDIAVGDLNGDGRVDLAVTLGSTNTVAVLLQQNNGTFGTPVVLPAGVSPEAVRIADLNGDGNTDLSVLNYRTSVTTSTSGAVSVLLGNGAGTFAAAVTTNVATYPRGFEVGDVTGDGRRDVVVASTGSNQIMILPGNGDGTWGTATVMAVGIQPRGPTLADLTEDGKRDIVVVNSSATDNTIQVLANQTSSSSAATRTIAYTYDGLRRLTDAVESPGNTFHYEYDVVGNSLSMQVNGVTTQQSTYDDANQVVGWTYDTRGNLLSDGTTTYTYDALGRLTSQTRGSVTTTNSYNGDGVLVAQQHGATTTRYLQDLAAPLPQVLRQRQGSTTTDYLYGLDRLASVQDTTRTWYGTDALGSVRQTLDNTGQPLTTLNYDPWGMPEGGTVPPTFGFTGELQDAASGSVYLRARWYQPGQRTFLGRDPFPGVPEQPYTLHPFHYGYSNPILNTDPSGQFCWWGWVGDTCPPPSRWTAAEEGAWLSAHPGVTRNSLRQLPGYHYNTYAQAIQFERSYGQVLADPLAACYGYGSTTYTEAGVYAEYFLQRSLAQDLAPIREAELAYLQDRVDRGEASEAERYRWLALLGMAGNQLGSDQLGPGMPGLAGTFDDTGRPRLNPRDSVEPPSGIRGGGTGRGGGDKVYHGTDAKSAADIEANGLNIAKWNEAGGSNINDPKGFSVTTNPDKAQDYAIGRALERGSTPVVLEADRATLQNVLRDKDPYHRYIVEPDELYIDPRDFRNVPGGIFRRIK